MNPDRIIAVRNSKTIYREGDRCIKVFEPMYKTSDVLKEAVNIALAKEAGICVPTLIDVGKTGSRWFITTEYIHGKTLLRHITENPETTEKYLALLVDLQLDIFEKPCNTLEKLKDKINIKISMTDLDATTRYDLHLRLEDMPRRSKFCHGDFVPSNLILGDDGKVYAIDWENAAHGNPFADAARTYLMMLLDREGGEEKAEIYLDIFCRRDETPRAYVLKWLPFVAAAYYLNCLESERSRLMEIIEKSE